MHLRIWILPAALPLLAALLLTSGCQRAKPYSPTLSVKAAKDPTKRVNIEVDEPKTLPDHLAWMDTDRELMRPGDVPIEFVHEGTSPEEWKKLSSFWNAPSLEQTLGMIGLPGLRALPNIARANASIKVKVPLGLDDPLADIPVANPPTKLKWELGRKLFHDPSWLTAKGKQSCASCHQPEHGFTDGKTSADGGYNVPTLVNVVYNTHQFWDGRATYLEEVVQRNLDDEREPKASPPFNHTWHGVIARLRDSKSYANLFEQTFGVAPTQDTVGKALATYMRTLLAGDSVHDRAVRIQQTKGARTLMAAHYAAVLDEKAMESLGRVSEAKDKVAKELARGHELFRGQGGCAACHATSNGQFSDGRFYNIGVEADRIDAEKEQRLGRFAWAPYGEKTRWLKGAYKVPTLRGLSRSKPYFHDGSAPDLVMAVRFHVKPPQPSKVFNLYLDRRLAGPGGEHRDLKLTEQDIADLVVFLKALDGGEVDAAVRANPK